MERLRRALTRWRLWLAVKALGRRRLPSALRKRLRVEQTSFNRRIQVHYGGKPWQTHALHEALVQPFQDLLNRPAGGEAYCGGVIFRDPALQPTLRHFRGERAIDRPLTALVSGQPSPLRLEGRHFWCGPLAFHFGHQIADFGSRALVASLDPRGGELLWCPWRTGTCLKELLPWQQFLLSYLNPGNKPHRICTRPLQLRELVVVPQQARMRAAPTPDHLEALSWCERVLVPRPLGVVYVSRARFAPCTNADLLKGAFAAEELLERFLQERGVTVVHPETLGLKEQLEIYLGAKTLIVAEGSAQHGLELLGVHPEKPIVVICRRPQLEGMGWPLRSRFPQVRFVQAIKSQWQARDGVAWNGLAMLDWHVVAMKLNPLLPRPLSESDCHALEEASEDQLQKLAARVPLTPCSSIAS